MRSVAMLLAVASTALAFQFAPPSRLPDPLPNRTLNVPILMYHLVGRLPTVLGPYSAGLTVQPRVFKAQMQWLVRHRFHAISEQHLFDALEWGKRLPRRPVLITFDDGYRDVMFNAAPVLHRLNMPATAFVTTNRIGGPDHSFLNWTQLRVLERDGFTIGSHTVHHFDLTTLSTAQAVLELNQSRKTLQKHLGVRVDWFAYPSGAENPSVVRLVRQAGYLLAVTTQPGFAQSARKPFLLHRFGISRSTGVAGFAALLSSDA